MSHGSCTIALVEKDDGMRSMVKDAIEQAGLAVREFPSFDRLQDRDLAILDSVWVGLLSPAADPVAELERFLADGALSFPILVYSTAPVDEDTLVRLFGMGIHDVISSPQPLRLLTAKARGFARNVRERVNREREHRLASQETEKRFRIMADQAPVMLWMAEADALCSFFNQTWLRFSGRTMAEEIGYGWAEGVHPEDFQTCADTYFDCFKKRRPFTMEYRLRRADGAYRWILDNAVPRFLEDGTFAGFIGSCVDITDIKEAQAERERVHAMERDARAVAERLHREALEASRLKDEFLATVSHELRTPLNAILGWAEILHSRQLDSANYPKIAETILRNARLQSSLIGDLLDMSRVITGKLQLEKELLDLAPILSQVFESLRLSAEAKKIEVIAVVAPDVGRVLGDPTRLQQIFWNILSNAIKFTPAFGRVTVTLAEQSGAVRFVVSDSGEGIEAGFLPHVFGLFRQADGQTSRRHGGLGLGLAIVKQLVELHGGTVEAMSAGRGKGATFQVSLPLAEAPAMRDPSSAAASQAMAQVTRPLRGIRILAVDDEPEVLQFVSFVLTQAGAEVELAETVEQALELVERTHPDVLLSDIAMPDVTGLDLIERLRGLSQCRRNMPALAFSAFARQEDRQRAIAAGYQDYLTKPILPDDLVEAVVRMIASE